MISITGWFYTGDVGYFDHNGDIFVLDHKQNIYYSIEGYIIPSQIEAALRYHSSVYNTCVMPVSYLNKLHLIILVEKSHEEAQVFEIFSIKKSIIILIITNLYYYVSD